MNTANHIYIPKTVSELWDLIGAFMLSSPTFIDDSGWFPNRNIETEFFALKEGLKHLRSKFGEEYYAQLDALADRMRVHFEADPEDSNGEAMAGRELILEMEDVIRAWRASRRTKAKPKPLVE
jgi:hypothetical protein